MISRLLSSQLRRNMASGGLTTALSTVASAIAIPFYLHYLGYKTYGVWLAITTVLEFARLANLGLGPAVTKLVAEEHGRGNVHGIEAYATASTAILCATGAAAFIVMLCLRSQIIGAFGLTGENATLADRLLPYAGLLLLCYFVLQTLWATLAGLGRMDLANYLQCGSRVVRAGIACCMLYWGRGMESLLVGEGASYLLACVASICLIRQTVRVRFLQVSTFDIRRIRMLLRFGTGVFGGDLIALLGIPVNKLLLSRYAGVGTLPIYDISVNMSMNLRGLADAGLRALLPEVSRINSWETPQRASRMAALYRRSMKLLGAFGLLAYVPILIFAGPLLRLWLRSGFVESLPAAFRVALIASFVSLLGVPSYYMLLGLGHVGEVFVARCITWITSISCVVMAGLFFGELSPVVVCLCLSLSWALSSSYLIWRHHRALRDLGPVCSATRAA